MWPFKKEVKKESDPVDFLKAMSVLKVEHGDIIVFKTDKNLGDLRHEFLEAIKYGIPDGTKAMLLEGGMDIGVLRKEQSKSIVNTIVNDYHNDGPIRHMMRGGSQ